MVAHHHGCLRTHRLLVCLLIGAAVAQFENYSFRRFPESDLVPLGTAYGLALDQYGAQNWTESIGSMELSLRLHRLLRDSVRHCVRHCGSGSGEGFVLGLSFRGAGSWSEGNPRDAWRRAACLKRCRLLHPALSLPHPGKDVMDAFDRRSPYRVLYFAHSELNDLQRAVPCAHTFLQRNPDDRELQQLMEGHGTQYDLEGYLNDQEERPHEVSFLKAVKLIGAGQYRKGVGNMERTLRLYLHEHELCRGECEATKVLWPSRDLYSDSADIHVEALRCQSRCEENLTPNVGGFFVERFLATIYHYLQYAYYKLNDGGRAVPCASTYLLLEPEDQVMKENLLYYRAYRQLWGLQPAHFAPRTEALKYHEEVVAQKQMLEFAEKYLRLDDEEFWGPEEAALGAADPPDSEFEGPGDYEEPLCAAWRQPRGKGDTGEAPA